MKKSIGKRIEITRTGKVRHRAPALGHARANKSSKQLHRKKGGRELKIRTNKLDGYLNITLCRA